MERRGEPTDRGEKLAEAKEQAQHIEQMKAERKELDTEIGRETAKAFNRDSQRIPEGWRKGFRPRITEALKQRPHEYSIERGSSLMADFWHTARGGQTVIEPEQTQPAPEKIMEQVREEVKQEKIIAHESRIDAEGMIADHITKDTSEAQALKQQAAQSQKDEITKEDERLMKSAYTNLKEQKAEQMQGNTQPEPAKAFNEAEAKAERDKKAFLNWCDDSRLISKLSPKREEQLKEAALVFDRKRNDYTFTPSDQNDLTRAFDNWTQQQQKREGTLEQKQIQAQHDLGHGLEMSLSRGGRGLRLRR